MKVWVKIFWCSIKQKVPFNVLVLHRTGTISLNACIPIHTLYKDEQTNSAVLDELGCILAGADYMHNGQTTEQPKPKFLGAVQTPTIDATGALEMATYKGSGGELRIWRGPWQGCSPFLSEATNPGAYK